MQLSDLDYSFPEHLIAVEPQAQFRALLSRGENLSELTKKGVLDLFRPGDV